MAGPEKVYAALTGNAKWTDPEFVDALNKLDDMQKKGWFMGGLDRYYTSLFERLESPCRRRRRDENRGDLVPPTPHSYSAEAGKH